MLTSYPVNTLSRELANSSGMHDRICSLTKVFWVLNDKEPPSLAEIFQGVKNKIIFYSWSYILDVSDVAEWCISRFWRSLSIFGNCLGNVPPGRLLWDWTNLHSTCTKTNCLGIFWVLCQITICIRLGDLGEEEREKRRKWEWGSDRERHERERERERERLREW